MKRRQWLQTAALSAAALGLTLVPKRSQGEGTKKPKLRVGLVFDVGGRGDKSFNDAAYAGVVEASRRFPIAFELAEPVFTEDREGALRLFAARGFDLIIAVGLIFTQDVWSVAKEFPNAKFACIDALPGQPPLPNVVGIRFREEEGSYLVGVAAGLQTKSRHLGFVGGMNVELIHRFEAGFGAGAKSVCPDCKLHSAYAGTTPDAFRDPAKGKAIGASQIAAGADIIFHASGSTGRGVFEACREAGRFAIGVDRDQAEDMPGVVITSMIKRVDQAVVSAIGQTLAGKFKSGFQSLGLKEKGVDWVHTGPHAAALKPSTIARVKQASEDIIAGRIRVSKKPPPR